MTASPPVRLATEITVEFENLSTDPLHTQEMELLKRAVVDSSRGEPWGRGYAD